MVAGAYVAREVECLAEDGRLVIIAVQGGVKSEFNAGLVLRKRLHDHRLDAAAAAGGLQGARSPQALREKVWPLLESGAVKPVIHSTFAAGASAAQGACADGIEPAHRQDRADLVNDDDMTKKKLIAGNWKMNGSLAANEALVQAAARGHGRRPPATWPSACRRRTWRRCRRCVAGIAARAGRAGCVGRTRRAPTPASSRRPCCKEFGVRYAIVGHSERRQYHGETDDAGGRQDHGRAGAAASRPSSASAKRWPSAKPGTPKKWSSASWRR